MSDPDPYESLESAAIRHLMTLYGKRLDDLSKVNHNNPTSKTKTKKIHYDFTGTLASSASISASLLENYRLQLDYELYDAKLFPVRPLKHEKRDQSWRSVKASAHVPIQQWIAAIDTDGYFHIFNQVGDDILKASSAPSSYRVADSHVITNIIAIDQSEHEKQLFVLSSVDGTLQIIETSIDAYKADKDVTYEHQIMQLLKTKISKKHKSNYITAGTVYRNKEICDVFVGDNHGRVMHYYYRFASKNKKDLLSTQFEFVYENDLSPVDAAPIASIMKYSNTLTIGAGSNVYFMDKETLQLSEFVLHANGTVTDLVFDNTYHNLYVRLGNGEVSIYRLIGKTRKNVKDAKPVKTLPSISATSHSSGSNTTVTVGTISKFKEYIVSSSNCDVNFYHAKRAASLSSLSGVVNTDLCYFYHPKYDAQYPGASSKFGFGGIVIDSSFISSKPVTQQAGGSMIANFFNTKPWKGNLLFAHNNRKVNGTNEILAAINYARGDYYSGSTLILYRTTNRNGRDSDQSFASSILDTLKPFTFLIGLLVIFLLRYSSGKKGKQSGGIVPNVMDKLMKDKKTADLIEMISRRTTQGSHETTNIVAQDDNNDPSFVKDSGTDTDNSNEGGTWKHRGSVYTSDSTESRSQMNSSF